MCFKKYQGNLKINKWSHQCKKTESKPETEWEELEEKNNKRLKSDQIEWTLKNWHICSKINQEKLTDMAKN